ncbi:MAG TPA: hypothetical protein DCY48_00510 [Candidatus Magasanikbacteria bacterium]|nr:MAG: hypothetical protein A3I74_02590 [Candidatus Magasanikbacteria bacterium RIFCSPLOWO2_02_FULL_47_16]OGH79608.1 MAG: hypothetical protein A3C10_00810 [Candidatus Magasanikbacteria bacterium RIFCSPHIGHO2_02_FULL_48_18]OGH82024.1 MAG: hypothetical protein A3G08_02320 [Candidatus Magasanikbacteria bacterium RIFCSPLOWO2_12_FULL_47_9b]HAZ28247.1 hypothetical protein [Candidatus Magasanikbacteria bacterium]
MWRCAEKKQKKIDNIFTLSYTHTIISNLFYMAKGGKMLETILETVLSLKETVSSLDKRVGSVEESVDFIKENAVTRDEFQEEIKGIRSVMVTKDYLDEKMADFRGDMVIVMRKGDTKLRALVDILKHKRVLSEKDVTKLKRMEPFSAEML